MRNSPNFSYKVFGRGEEDATQFKETAETRSLAQCLGCSCPLNEPLSYFPSTRERRRRGTWCCLWSCWVPRRISIQSWLSLQWQKTDGVADAPPRFRLWSQQDHSVSSFLFLFCSPKVGGEEHVSHPTGWVLNHFSQLGSQAGWELSTCFLLLSNKHRISEV